jgi:hypothetical protein
MSVGFTKPSGILDGVRAYARYATRVESAVDHQHPWYYYLQLITWWRPAPGPVWSEGVIIPLAVIGAIAAATGVGVRPERRAAAVFVAAFTAALITAYAAVAYKTPWCLLSFLLGLIILAGIGTSALVRLLSRSKVAIAALSVLLGWATVTLGVQAVWVSVKLPTDPRNPYVYAGTLRGACDLGDYVDEHAALGLMPVVSVQCDESPWPLPWYVRKVPAFYGMESVSQEMNFHSIRVTDHAYPPGVMDGFDAEWYGIRPGYRVVVYTPHELFKTFLSRRAEKGGRP